MIHFVTQFPSERNDSMKISVKPAILKYLVLAAGGLGLVLRALLYALTTDEQGLLARNHPLAILLSALTIVVLAGVFLLSRSITGPERYSDCFQPSLPGGIGCMLAAVGILITTISEMGSASDSVDLVVRVMAFAAIGALIVAGLSRLMGSRASFLFYVALCLYFCVRMVSQYRHWSSNPQLQDYCFHLLACVGLMLTAYHHAAFGADMSSHRNLWFYALATVYLCCVSLAGPEHQLFYLGTGIWAFTSLSNLTPKKRRQRPNLNLEEEPGTGEV